jgi:hypothetical protein
MDFNNREIVSLLLLGAFVIGVLFIPGVRSSLRSAISILFDPTIVLSILGLVTYLVAIIYLAHSIGLWRMTLLKETLIWFFLPGLALFSNFGRISEGKRIIGKTAGKLLIATILIEFFMNLFVLAAWAEIALQILLFLIVVLLPVAQANPDARNVVGPLEMLRAIVGFSLAGYIIWQLVFRWNQLDKSELLLELVLPLWLTVALLPFVFLMGALSAYQNAFNQIDRFTDDPRRRRRAKLALVATYIGRIKQVGSFGRAWGREATEAESFTESRDVVRRYRDSFSE